MYVVITPYDPHWPQDFQKIKARLEKHLSDVPIISIEHVGSTSVPQLAAKPIIDIDIIVARADVQAAIDALSTRADFKYLGELGIADRHALHDPEQEPKRNIYICVDGAFQTRNHLGLRDTLRANAELRDDYARVKMELASRSGVTIDQYIEGKSGVIQKILVEAGLLSEKELGDVKQANESGNRVAKIETERLVLREFVLGDVDGYWRLESKEEVVQYQDYGPKTKEEARQYVVDAIRGSFEVSRPVVELAVTCDGQFIGRIGAKITEGKQEGSDEERRMHASLWFSFEPEWQGKGLATEAVRAFIPALGSPALLEIECDPRNTGSMSMAKRLGFRLVSQADAVYECKGEWVGSAVYQKLV